jgi:lipopolysaccharide biosynthesis glycosyltransferase
MSKAIIVSAADSGYWPYLSGLLNSIDRRHRAGRVTVGILDLGLSLDQRRCLEDYGALVQVPDWDYDVTGFDRVPAPTFRAMTARPHLPRYFPGFDCHVWIDADCWVQDWHAVKTLISEAGRHDLVIVPEIDRSYTAFLANGGTFFDWSYSCLSKCYDETLAKHLAYYPPLNCGVFAAKSKSSIWPAWAEQLGHVLARIATPFFFAEQTALNVVARQDNIDVVLLPARYNWMCNRAMPMLSADGKALVDPNPPHDPLGIIHLAAGTRDGIWPIADMAGRTHHRSLAFPQLRSGGGRE